MQVHKFSYIASLFKKNPQKTPTKRRFETTTFIAIQQFAWRIELVSQVCISTSSISLFV